MNQMYLSNIMPNRIRVSKWSLIYVIYIIYIRLNILKQYFTIDIISIECKIGYFNSTVA